MFARLLRAALGVGADRRDELLGEVAAEGAAHTLHVAVVLLGADLQAQQNCQGMAVDEDDHPPVALLGEELLELLDVHFGTGGLALLLFLTVLHLGKADVGVDDLQDVDQGLVGLGRLLVLLGQPLGGALLDEPQVIGGVGGDQRLDTGLDGTLVQVAHLQAVHGRLPQLQLIEDHVGLLEAHAVDAEVAVVLLLVHEGGDPILGLLALLEETLDGLGLGQRLDAEEVQDGRHILDQDLVPLGIFLVGDEGHHNLSLAGLATGADQRDQLGDTQADDRIIHGGLLDRLNGPLDDLLEAHLAGLDRVDGVVVRQEVELLVLDIPVVDGGARQSLGQTEGRHVLVLGEHLIPYGVLVSNDYQCHVVSSFCIVSGMWVWTAWTEVILLFSVQSKYNALRL